MLDTQKTCTNTAPSSHPPNLSPYPRSANYLYAVTAAAHDGRLRHVQVSAHLPALVCELRRAPRAAHVMRTWLTSIRPLQAQQGEGQLAFEHVEIPRDHAAALGDVQQNLYTGKQEQPIKNWQKTKQANQKLAENKISQSKLAENKNSQSKTGRKQDQPIKN